MTHINSQSYSISYIHHTILATSTSKHYHYAQSRTYVTRQTTIRAFVTYYKTALQCVIGPQIVTAVNRNSVMSTINLEVTRLEQIRVHTAEPRRPRHFVGACGREHCLAAPARPPRTPSERVLSGRKHGAPTQLGKLAPKRRRVTLLSVTGMQLTFSAVRCRVGACMCPHSCRHTQRGPGTDGGSQTSAGTDEP
jgi:hypothetical protein